MASFLGEHNAFDETTTENLPHAFNSLIEKTTTRTFEVTDTVVVDTESADIGSSSNVVSDDITSPEKLQNLLDPFNILSNDVHLVLQSRRNIFPLKMIQFIYSKNKIVNNNK